ncbi:MAG: thioesterase family protein [Flavobacteriales bacterium]|nr:thioesterase family protein [Flavobacteriales bacterium]
MDEPVIKYVNKVRVRYNDTDKMGIVYHGNYPMYFEVSRLEMLRARGLEYRKMEEMGVMLPVSEIKIKYIRSAFYDDVLDVEVTLKARPAVRVMFDYRVTNQKGELICTGSVTLACVDALTRRPCRAPEYFLDCFPEYTEKE